MVHYHDGSTELLNAMGLIAPLERAPRVLWLAAVLLSGAVLAARWT